MILEALGITLDENAYHLSKKVVQGQDLLGIVLTINQKVARAVLLSRRQALSNSITAQPAVGALGGVLSVTDYPEGDERRITRVHRFMPRA